MSQKATILYIEDDDASRVLIQRVLTYAGYRVLIATRALDGIDMAKKHHPDLILTDINLPDLSGREIIVRLRADPHLAAVPIVALTAQSHDFERDKTFVAGATGYITKPIDAVALTGQIVEYLEGRRDSASSASLESAQRAYNQELVERLENNMRDLETSYRDLRRLDRIKDDFIQLTAHELRTPLTTVYGYSRLVQTSPAILAVMGQDLEVNACLTGLLESIERLNKVVNEIITVSRIATGRVDLKLSPTHISQVISQVSEGYKQVLEQRKIKLVTANQEWPAPFYADAALLELALNNLVSNAIKYTPDEGTITIEVPPASAEHVKIRIKDTGIGIDAKDQQHIFDRFYTAGDTQLHSTSKTAFRGGGLGLGLAICRGIVEAHGGKIWVESAGYDEKGLPGSTFVIELPLNSGVPGQTRRTFL
ncbi:MAG: hybrid sensor histidine kinase/response regulator [Chloroflexi bacterium]|nr:hybrid sensor histidine kinase/response regulator [Chloroflexota bacterium]